MKAHQTFGKNIYVWKDYISKKPHLINIKKMINDKDHQTQIIPLFVYQLPQGRWSPTFHHFMKKRHKCVTLL